ncbi:hypothetical protein [Halostella sp. PRR32]|uniref:hypothetical protein n=1 Tax=Halostella sp. PRR32 TaxID=3098147 RepID=UPI002B1D8D6C|nr:hypothetical protein [Halostella sp. PRR32]
MSLPQNANNGSDDDGPVVRATNETNGIETSEIDTDATVAALDGARALVCERNTDAPYWRGQRLPATIDAPRKLVDDHSRVRVTFDRYDRSDIVPVGMVAEVLAGEVSLGVDQAGDRHVWYPIDNVVRVLDADGDVVREVDQDEFDGRDVRTWTKFVADRRGWARPAEGRDD